MALQDAAFHAQRALEALEDPRIGDDDLDQARRQHLFYALENLARAYPNKDIPRDLHEWIWLAIGAFFAGAWDFARIRVRDFLNHEVIKPFAKVQ